MRDELVVAGWPGSISHAVTYSLALLRRHVAVAITHLLAAVMVHTVEATVVLADASLFVG
jgi:hypothetical protein